MHIEASIEPLLYEAAFYSAGLEDADPRTMGALAERASATLRVLASMLLLGRADHEGYTHNLCRSGCVRARYLERTAGQGAVADWRRCASRSLPALQDAIAAQAWDIAAEIAAGTPRAWAARNEYEADFAHTMALMALLPGAPAAAAEPALAAFVTALDGDADPTMPVLAALAAGDQAAFDAAFDDLVLAREDAARAERARIEDDATFATRHLHIPGLALLRLAARRGLEARERPPLCPAVALRAPLTPYLRDI